MADYDLTIVGGGPSGSACAIVAAQAGMRVLVIEKAVFPREKVCGDCVNPRCWPLLDRLGAAEEVLRQPHSKLKEVQFLGITGRPLRFSLDQGQRGEIAIKRSLLDRVLLNQAKAVGADVHEDTTLHALDASAEGWRLNQRWNTRLLVAADGRNSTVAHLLGIAPAPFRERVGLQAHLPGQNRFTSKVVMRLLEHGYCGIASVSDQELNLCLVSTPEKIPALKAWAEREFSLATSQSWRTITPLSRDPLPALHGKLLLVGDAARVVEPFTGEGIYYALATGIAAADAIIADDLSRYPQEHRRIYRGKLWVNRLAKYAVLNPLIASGLLAFAPKGVMRFLTSKVVPLSPMAPGPATN